MKYIKRKIDAFKHKICNPHNPTHKFKEHCGVRVLLKLPKTRFSIKFLASELQLQSQITTLRFQEFATLSGEQPIVFVNWNIFQTHKYSNF